MSRTPLPSAQLGLPEFLPDLIGLAGAIVLVLILVAATSFVYKSLTGGIEWPTDESDDENGDGLRQGDGDDEWDYY